MLTPPRSGERESKCASCGGAHGTRDCPNAELPEAKRKCSNCSEEGHRASARKKPDRRKQPQSGSKDLLVKEHFFGVVTSASGPVPVPVCDIPLRQPGAQARRKVAEKALIGANTCKCSNTSCNLIDNTYMSVYPVQHAYKDLLAQGKIGASVCVPGATAVSKVSLSRGVGEASS